MRIGRRGFRLKGLKRYESGGIEYIYHRATGIRLPDLPENDPKFIEAFLAAENQPKPNKRNGAGSLEAAANAFMRSSTYTAYSENYKGMLRRQFRDMIKNYGHVPFASIQQRHISKDLSKLKANAANNRLKAWRALCVHTKTYLRDDNPCSGLKKQPSPTQRGRIPWDSEDIKKFRSHFAFGSQERLAFELLYWTGARMSDAVGLGEGKVCKDGWLNYTQVKTGGAVAIPFRREVPDCANPSDLKMLHEAICAIDQKHMTFMVTAYGSSRSQKSASSWFAKAARNAGIHGKTAHGLRKTRSIELAERGATTHQIGAWTGHESLEEIKRYTMAANRKRVLSGVKPEQKLSKNSTL